LNNLKSVYVIAEIGINHNGDMQLAKELIDKSHVAGANAVKFQKRDIGLVYTKQELDKYRESPWGTTNRQQKEGLEFSIQQYIELESYTNSLGLDFVVSCWDVASVDLIEKHLNIRYHKVASALTTDRKFLEKLNSTGRPVILSTGMCTEKQIAAAIEILDNVKIVLACTSTYPTTAREINLKHICTLKTNYPDVEIGFSNHYNGADACVGATALGASCVEFHITNDRTAYGSDQAASIQNASEVIDAIRKMELMLGDGVKKVYDSEKPIAKKLRK
tara:strand:+ start:19951 stop:20778 length:828 start_codon:yes stop_codon:yes gene_type:complete